MELKTFTKRETFIEESAARIAAACHHTETHQPPFIAFSGGATPAPIYEQFASRFLPNIDTRIHGFLVDERYVAIDHEQSNGRMIIDHLMRHVPSHSRGQIVSMQLFDTDQNIENARISYEKEIKYKLDSGFSFDLVVLGIGEDGHVASLFPHSTALHEDQELIATTVAPDPETRIRLSMTFPLIMQAKQLLLLVAGKRKKDIMARFIKGNESIDNLPAIKLKEHPNLQVHYLKK